MAIGGSVAGAQHHPDAWFSGRLAGDAAGTTDAPTLYTASTANYNPGNNRWGDYSAVSLDPSDDMTMWTIQEHVSSTNSWGTRIAKLRAPGPAIPASASPRALTGQASVDVTLTGTTTGGRGFFDPGPGFNRPAVSAGCGVDVTAVTVDSPSQATLTLDTTAATNAPCDVTFTNPDGQSANSAVKLLERPPAATDDSGSVVHDSVLNGSSVLANDSDPDGDSLTAAKASDPAHGTVTVNANGTYTYTPAAGYIGPDSFTYTASDGTLQDTGTVSITVTATGNHAPVAVDDAYSVAQDTVLNGSSLLANDTDADGDTLTAAKATDPSHGTVTVNSDGTFTYTPAAGYVGPDSFTYTVSDGALQDTGTASITVTHVNHAPVATDDAFSVAQDATLSGTLLANDSDPDGDTLTAAKATDPGHGSVTVNADGTFTYMPAAGYVGPDSFTYTVSDGALQDTGAASITVTHVNHAPVAVDDAYSVAQDTTLNGTSLLVNDSDPDGDGLTATQASNPAHGSVTVNPDGTFTYAPAAGYTGPDAFTYTASDGALQDASVVSITVTALPDFSNPGTTPTPITKLTLKLKQLKKRHGKRRLRASGNAPDDASVRVVLYRAKKRVAGRTVTATDRRWRVVFRFKRHGRYRVVAKTGLQRVSAKKRI
jgi:VCBS repeat-containing protein